MNQKIFQRLFDQYFDRVRNYTFYRCGDPELATDIAQEAFMRIWEKKLNPDEGKEKALLFKIAGDLFINEYRKKQTALKFAMEPESHAMNPSPEHEMSYNELKEKYEKSLSNMNEKHRIVFLMSRNDGMKYKEIASFLDISVKAVEKRMHEALNYLKVQLKNER